jgi:hypothetical protein
MTFPWLLLASMNALMTLDLKEAKALLDALAASSEQTQARTRRAQALLRKKSPTSRVASVITRRVFSSAISVLGKSTTIRSGVGQRRAADSVSKEQPQPGVRLRHRLKNF